MTLVAQPQRTIYAGDELIREMVSAAASFRYFLRNHVYIADRAADGQLLGVLKWEWWPVHDEICDDLETQPRLVILKARQIGLSWLVAAYQLHGAMFTPNFLGGQVSAGQTEASELLSKAVFILAHLPYATLPTLVTENKSELRFAATNGAIMSFPSTPNAGRGYTFSRFVADEAAFHEHAALNYEAYSIAAEYGQILIVSSAGTDEEQGAANPWFQRFWLAARDGSNGFTARFYPYTARPGRDEAWYARESQRLSGHPGAMLREFPRTPEEAFRSMLALRFDVEAMDAALAASRAPLSAVTLPDGINRVHLQQTTLRIWALPRPGIPYVAYTEAAEGKGRDYTVSGIMEARTLRHVATLRDNTLEPGQHASIMEQLCRWYNTAFWGQERNRGEAVLYIVGQTNYPRVYWHEESRTLNQLRGQGEPTKRLGFPVTDSTRSGLIDDLAQVIVDRSLDSDDTVFWRECLSFIVTDRGRAEGATGAHDDEVMMMAGLIRMARQPGAQTLRETDRRLRQPARYSYGSGGQQQQQQAASRREQERAFFGTSQGQVWRAR